MKLPQKIKPIEVTWTPDDIEDTRIEAELGASYKKLPAGKPPRTISARPKPKRYALTPR